MDSREIKCPVDLSSCDRAVVGSGEQRAEVLPRRHGTDEMEWLSSLPHCQLDLLIYLKELVTLRSRHHGREELADKFQPKILRMLGVLLVEYMKERMKGSSIFPYTSEELDMINTQLMAHSDTAS